jgi:hypothetical protein
MVPELAALRAGAAALLRAQGRADLADVLESGELQLSGEPQTWLVGSREVTAHVIAIVLAAPELVALTRQPAALDRVRDALAQAMASPTTALAELLPVMRLPAIGRAWQTAYRSVPISEMPERPPPSAVLAGAADLLEALGRHGAAEVARRGELDVADVPTSGERALVRYVLHLTAPDLALAKRDAAIAEELREAITEAGTRAAEAVADVELRLRV